MSHDSGVCLIRNDKVLAALNEERLSRLKQAPGVPFLALRQICALAGVSPSDITHVAVANRLQTAAPPLTSNFCDEQGHCPLSMRIAEILDSIPGGAALLRSPMALSLYQTFGKFAPSALLRRLRAALQELGIHAPIKLYDHHDCHIAAGYYTSGQDRCVVLSNDGFGDGACSKVGLGEGGKLRTFNANSFYNSIGVYYNHVTHFCGFTKAHHAGKVTGLAAHGDASRTLKFFENAISWSEKHERYVNRLGVFRNALNIIHREFSGVDPKHLAAGIQRHLENTLANMAAHFRRKFSCPNICLTGGVHANVRVNQVISEVDNFGNVYVFPHMGDGGLAMGAAFLGLTNGGSKELTPRRLEHVYFGPDFSDKDLTNALQDQGLAFDRPANIAGEAADHLANGRIVARFDGKMEYGPRALGNRSILYRAGDPKVNTWLNQQLKRTEFMPFAPVLRELDASKYLENYSSATAHTAQFMTITYRVTQRCKDEAPAVVHIDSTARPQILKPGLNDGYYNILSEYDRLTGCGVLVNTSFNLHEEPIICTPKEAIRSFFESNLDVLILGPFLIKNPTRMQAWNSANATA